MNILDLFDKEKSKKFALISLQKAQSLDDKDIDSEIQKNFKNIENDHTVIILITLCTMYIFPDFRDEYIKDNELQQELIKNTKDYMNVTITELQYVERMKKVIYSYHHLPIDV